MTRMPHDTAPRQRDQPNIDGLPNFRDLGGVDTLDGRRVRHGRVFRSQGFEAATAEALDALSELDIRLVCDLRSLRERERAPSRWPRSAKPARIEFDLRTDVRAQGGVRAAFLQQADAAGAYRGMIANYQNMPEAFASVLPELFGRLLDEQSLPAVIHCHAGKDRTGFACAMLLFALGVSREQVYEDYLRSGQKLDQAAMSAQLVELFEQGTGLSLTADALLPVAEVHAAYLDAALSRIERDHGSIDRYLDSVAGLDRARRQRLRALLLSE